MKLVFLLSLQLIGFINDYIYWMIGCLLFVSHINIRWTSFHQMIFKIEIVVLQWKFASTFVANSFRSVLLFNTPFLILLWVVKIDFLGNSIIEAGGWRVAICEIMVGYYNLVIVCTYGQVNWNSIQHIAECIIKSYFQFSLVLISCCYLDMIYSKFIWKMCLKGRCKASSIS